MKPLQEIVGELQLFFAATSAHGFQYLANYQSHGIIRVFIWLAIITLGIH